MTTLTLIVLIFAACFAVILVYDRLEQRSKRRDREIVRRIRQYLASLPPARPW